MRRITTIGFDADDTLWHNENIFEDHHKKYCALLSEYHDPKTVEEKLYEREMQNLELFGYGVKGFTLSCIETAIQLTKGEIKAEEIQRIIDYCREMLSHPVELLPQVKEVIEKLADRFRLLVITKGDLRDQERKIAKSGIAHCFDHIEVVADKSVESYARAFQRSHTIIDQFLMVGNSLKSDVLPVIELGGQAVHIPYHLTWKHERVDNPPHEKDRLFELESISELPELLAALQPDIA